MKPTTFPEKNKIFHKPKGMTDEECQSMDVWENETMKISCWEFTPEELLHAIFFRKIWLRVFLNIQPPVYLSPEFPFNFDINGNKPEPIENIVKMMTERKVKQFLRQRLANCENIQNAEEISSIQSQWIEQLLIDYTNFFVGVKNDE